jgi:hypothetical protein
MFAQASGNPEFALSMEEGADFLSKAQNVARHYSAETTQKTLDWLTFIGAGAVMYGSRAVAVANRKAGERREGASGSVLNFRSPLRRGTPPVAEVKIAEPFVPSTPPEPPEPGVNG